MIEGEAQASTLLVIELAIEPGDRGFGGSGATRSGLRRGRRDRPRTDRGQRSSQGGRAGNSDELATRGGETNAQIVGTVSIRHGGMGLDDGISTGAGGWRELPRAYPPCEPRA